MAAGKIYQKYSRNINIVVLVIVLLWGIYEYLLRKSILTTCIQVSKTKT